MEIRYLTQEEHEKSRTLYEEVFVEDEKAFVDPNVELVKLENMGHASMASLHPQEMAERFRRMGECPS